jgi:hypothetical protein
MNNKKNLFIIIFGGAALLAALHFVGSDRSAKVTSDLPASDSVEQLPSQPTKASPAIESAAAIANSPASFGPHLREIGQCLQIGNALGDNAKPTFDELQSSLRPALGDLTADVLDWKNVHITLANGEKRRLRVEIEGTGEESNHRRLKYYGVDAEDLPVPLPLPKEQSLNPSDAFIASLEKEGSVTLREEAHRGVYSQEAELYYVERNGVLSEIELSYQGKSVKCEGLDGAQGNCHCF